jgi:hypothetical protein
MTRRNNARLAGVAFLLYIAVGITSLVLPDGNVPAEVLVSLLIWIIALSLAVSLYALTRDEDRDLALLALCCRVSESMFAAISPVLTLGAAGLEPNAPLAVLLREVGGWNTPVAAFLFAVGSTIFCYLFLRGRMIPVPLAWPGVLASVLLVIALPLNLAGMLPNTVVNYLWAPMALFEIPLGVLLIWKGTSNPVVAG